MNKTWGAVKSAGSTIKATTQQAANLATKQVKSSVGIRDDSRRITEELHKLFDDTDSFYFSFDCDITNNLQRHGFNFDDAQPEPDSRFFWNKYMLREILKLKVGWLYLHIVRNKLLIHIYFLCRIRPGHCPSYRDLCKWRHAS